MRQIRKGFTLVELLMVIVIIAILIGLVVTGLRMYANRTAAADTHTVLQNLQAMLTDYRGELPTNAEVAAGAINPDDSNSPAMAQTILVLNRLRSIPANKKAWDAFPSDRIKQIGTNFVVLDSWERPIIFVPGNPNQTTGLTGVSGAGTIKAPNGRPFFFSAGPDQDYRTGADNIYSFQN